MNLLLRIAPRVSLLAALSLFVAAPSTSIAGTAVHTATFPLGPYLNGGSHTFPPASFHADARPPSARRPPRRR